MWPDIAIDAPADRLLLVGASDAVRHLVAARYRKYHVEALDNYLAAIAAADRGAIRGVIISVDPNRRRFRSTVQGLRDVCGPRARVVLCCEPSCEGLARDALSAGADDYVIHPPAGEELDAALGIPPSAVTAPTVPGAATIGPEDLDAVGALLDDVAEGQPALLQSSAEWLRTSLRAGGVRVVADRLTGEAGITADAAALFEPLARDGASIGQIEVWAPRSGPFTPGDAEKLRRCARLLERVLSTAERQARWRRIALTDELTGLPNRRYLEAFLDRVLAQAADERMRVTFLFFDIDNFKQYNDLYGHSVGDQIIREAGHLFRQCCRRHDVVARFGGDEFGVVFWDAEEPRVAGSKHPESVLSVLDRFRETLERHTFSSLGAQAKGSLTVSGGMAGFPWDARTRDELVRKADQALLLAKRQGKNRIHLVGH